MAARNFAAVIAAALACAGAARAADTLATVAAQLASPPADARPMVRWWWFGPAVAKPELERELLAMKAGGFGGVEIQPVYPMQIDGNVPYLSPEFLDAVSFANRTARANGLRVDMTLASGWPYGGPHVKVTEASSRLRLASIDVPAGATSFAMPALGAGEKLLSVLVNGSPVDVRPVDGRASLASASQACTVQVYIASRTGQQVKRAAVGAEGFVLDHMSRSAVEHHLDAVGTPLLKAFGDTPPYAVFSDSLEAYGSDWTDDFPEEFKRRRGYDLAPHLPAIYGGQGADAAALRHDWGLTLTELLNERYLTPIDNWARAHGTRFRSQTYGEPAVSLSSNRLVALPEGEGPQFRAFSFTRLATSAAHLYGRPVVSAETWTWLHSPAFAATPLDMKAEADRMLLQGVNQFVGHGWPYTPPGTPEPGYSFYAAAVFNDHQPWWNVMPDVNNYLQRMSFLMRQGLPANDVAVFLPNDDVYAAFEPGKASLSALMAKHITPELTTGILDAGHNLDYVDAESVLTVGLTHPVLVMPRVERLAPNVIAKIAAWVKSGGKLIVIGSAPTLAPGFADAARITAEVVAASNSLTGPNVQLITDENALGAALQKAIAPDLKLSAQQDDVGFVHRKLADADVYFIANTSNHEVSASARVRSPRRYAAWWNPDTGAVTAAPVAPSMTLAPYESRVLVLSDKPQGAVPAFAPASVLLDLSRDWTVSFPTTTPVSMPELRSWPEHFSGIATYNMELTLDAAQLQGARISLDFGTGTPLSTTPKVPAGMRAMFDSPLREAAQVLVNGKRAGAVWHPPYRLEVTPFLQPGRNRIEVQVANTALNEMAGLSRPDYRLLSARYGQRFIPQDTELIQAQPSGMLGPVRLMKESIR